MSPLCLDLGCWCIYFSNCCFRFWFQFIIFINLFSLFFISFNISFCVEKFHTRKQTEKWAIGFHRHSHRTRNIRFDCKDVYFTTDTRRVVVVPFFLRANGRAAWTQAALKIAFMCIHDDNWSFWAPFFSWKNVAACVLCPLRIRNPLEISQTVSIVAVFQIHSVVRFSDTIMLLAFPSRYLLRHRQKLSNVYDWCLWRLSFQLRLGKMLNSMPLLGCSSNTVIGIESISLYTIKSHAPNNMSQKLCVRKILCQN